MILTPALVSSLFVVQYARKTRKQKIMENKKTKDYARPDHHRAGFGLVKGCIEMQRLGPRIYGVAGRKVWNIPSRSGIAEQNFAGDPDIREE
jgi:hypothetical protein